MDKVYLLKKLSSNEIITISKIKDFPGAEREGCVLIEKELKDLPAALQEFSFHIRYRFVSGEFIEIVEDSSQYNNSASL